MRRWAILILGVSAPVSVAIAAERVPCKYNRSVKETCAPVGCVSTATGADDAEFGGPAPGSAGFCGLCAADSDCGGEFCDRASGLCRYRSDPVPPEPIWPHFHLVTVDIALGLADQEVNRFKPIFGVGYVFEGAFRKTSPVQREDKSWVTKDVPSWYFRAGGAIALAGPAQNLFLELGPSYYFGYGPLAITSISVTALYQLQGSSILELGDLEKNFHRLGPSIGISFLHNLTIAGAVVFPLGTSSVNDSIGGYVIVRYDRDILSDLIPDRYLKFIPEAFR